MPSVITAPVICLWAVISHCCLGSSEMWVWMARKTRWIHNAKCILCVRMLGHKHFIISAKQAYAQPSRHVVKPDFICLSVSASVTLNRAHRNSLKKLLWPSGSNRSIDLVADSFFVNSSAAKLIVFQILCYGSECSSKRSFLTWNERLGKLNVRESTKSNEMIVWTRQAVVKIQYHDLDQSVWMDRIIQWPTDRQCSP